MRAAAAFQCDLAVVHGRQHGISLRPEPFSARQQKHSRLDGQPEEMDDDGRLRPHLPTTATDHNGHVRAESDAAMAEQRSPQEVYKELPLTGAVQSMMPSYRLSKTFGNISVPDEYGHDTVHRGVDTGRAALGELHDVDREYQRSEDGELVGLRTPSGALATDDDITEGGAS